MIGYGENRKEYWLYDVQKQRIMYSCDFVFNEMSGGLEKSEAKSKLPYVRIECSNDDEGMDNVNDTDESEVLTSMESFNKNQIMLRNQLFNAQQEQENIVYSRIFFDFVYIFRLSCHLFILFDKINLTMSSILKLGS